MILRYSNGEAERERDGWGGEGKNNTRPSSDLHPFAYVAARVSLSLSLTHSSISELMEKWCSRCLLADEADGDGGPAPPTLITNIELC